MRAPQTGGYSLSSALAPFSLTILSAMAKSDTLRELRMFSKTSENAITSSPPAVVRLHRCLWLFPDLCSGRAAMGYG